MEFSFDFIKPWLPAVGVFILFTILRYVHKNILTVLLKRFSDVISFEHGKDLVEAFEKPINVILYVLGFYFFMNMAPSATLNNMVFVDRVLRSTVVISFFWGLYNISDTTHGIMLDVVEKIGLQANDVLASVCTTVLRIITVILGFAAIAREWNYDITGFIASLSIGSVAVAFAAKDTLANVFGSLIIILEKPFKNGDWIMANGIEGTVEKITFRSTCIRTFPQELVYVPNSLLSNTPITNFTLRNKRRIDITLGLTYSSKPEQMQAFIEDVKNYIISNHKLYPESARVNFTIFNASSLDVQIICYARTGDQAAFLNIRQEVNFRLMQLLEEHGLSCAFPSTSVYFENELTNKTPNEAE